MYEEVFYYSQTLQLQWEGIASYWCPDPHGYPTKPTSPGYWQFDEDRFQRRAESNWDSFTFHCTDSKEWDNKEEDDKEVDDNKKDDCNKEDDDYKEVDDKEEDDKEEDDKEEDDKEEDDKEILVQTK